MLANVGDLPYVIVIALVVLIGGSQLPKIARNLGLAGKEFRKAQSEAEEEQAAKAQAAAQAAAMPPPVALPPTTPTAATPTAATPTAATPAPTATTAPAAAPAQTATTAPAEGEGNITLTPAQLDALLKAREEQVRDDPGPASN